MEIFLIIIHVIVCIALIMIVLLQTGKGADMGAAFGGGGSQTLFGSSGASTFLSKATTGAAIIFMLTSLFLAYFSSNRPSSGSVITDTPAPVEDTAQPPASVPEESATPQAEEPAAETPADTSQAPDESPAEDTATPETDSPPEPAVSETPAESGETTSN